MWTEFQWCERRRRRAVGIALVVGGFGVRARCESATAPTLGGGPNVANARQESSADPHDPDATVVVATGDPDIDVPAVQAAVDRGGTVVLEGQFSFDKAPTKVIAANLSTAPPGLAYAPAAEVLVSTAVTITGSGEPGRAVTTIEGGTIPFYVDAPAQRVTIRQLRFAKPTSSAVLVYAARDLTIASLAIAGVVPFKNLSDGIGVNTSGPPPALAAPGHPENVSGAVNLMHNDIDMTGGTTADNTLGMVVFAVGTTDAPVEARVAGNRVRNTTEPAINFRQIAGRGTVVHNVITTGPVAANVTRDQAIRVAGTGVYRIADNVIECDWVNADAEAIGVFSAAASSSIDGTVVENNDVRMSAPAGTVFTAFSAGIGVFGFAQNTLVRHNTIRGSARAALSIPVFPLPPQAPANPGNTAFVDNRFVDFTPVVADIFVGPGALDTRIVGPATVEDDGTGTTILRALAESGARGTPLRSTSPSH
jgi:hypothetical protein